MLASYLKKLKQQSKLDTDRSAVAVKPAIVKDVTSSFAMPQVSRQVPRASSPRPRSPFGGSDVGSPLDPMDGLEGNAAPVVPDSDASTYCCCERHFIVRVACVHTSVQL